jgi:hypothetical protein
VGVKGAVNPHISYSLHYAEWEAAIAAGASLDELFKLEDYPKIFRAKLIAWHSKHKAVEMHAQDAVSSKPKKR